MKKVSLITDGSCLGNPGPGGWACILRFGGVKKEFFGFDPHTTNNWKRRQWWRKHEPVRNVDLWMELDELASLNKTTWLWTRGHAGHTDNSRCDWLAQNAASTQRSCWADGRRYAPLRLNLGADYVPPKPQLGLFEDFGSNDDEQESGRNLVV
jgi:ribonuclease HI